MVYYNALYIYNWVVFHPLYHPTNQGFFIAHLAWFSDLSLAGEFLLQQFQHWVSNTSSHYTHKRGGQKNIRRLDLPPYAVAVTTRITVLAGIIPINLHLPLFEGGGLTQYIGHLLQRAGWKKTVKSRPGQPKLPIRANPKIAPICLSFLCFICLIFSSKQILKLIGITTLPKTNSEFSHTPESRKTESQKAIAASLFWKKRQKTSHQVRFSLLVGGWTNPFEKYARQIGSFPQVGMKIKNIWNHHLG